jgi:CRISPR-associated protein Cas2
MNPDAYRIMWSVVLFDLPTETKQQRRNYALFRKALLKAGFTRFQFSVYIRHALSREHMLVHHRRVQAVLPPQGRVSIMQLTDKQFGLIQVFDGTIPTDAPEPTDQLYMFADDEHGYGEATSYLSAIAAEPRTPYVASPLLPEEEPSEVPLGGLLAAAADAPHIGAVTAQKPKKGKKPKELPDDGQLFIF